MLPLWVLVARLKADGFLLLLHPDWGIDLLCDGTDKRAERKDGVEHRHRSSPSAYHVEHGNARYAPSERALYLLPLREFSYFPVLSAVRQLIPPFYPSSLGPPFFQSISIREGPFIPFTPLESTPLVLLSQPN